MEQTDLFDKPLRKKPVRWCLSTNHQNLMYMLSAGLILSPKGFGKKYYADVLETFPGWIPLFADAVPKPVINQSASEASHLKPCVATIHLAVTGPVTAISMDGSVREIAFPDGLTGMEAAILLPAPLPASWIDTIAFQSKKDKQACERDVQEYGNVPLGEYKRKVDSRLLAGSNVGTWPPPNGFAPANRDESPDAALAAGAMMAMLFQLANIGDEAVQSCRLAFDGEAHVAARITDPLIRGLFDWRETGHAPPANDILPSLFWGSVNQVVRSRSAHDRPNPLDTVFSFLDTAKDAMNDKLKAALTRLLAELRAIAGYADSTISEIFERHPKNFSRVMALFFLRKKCAELLAFKHPLLSETDYVVSALIFAARDGWLGLPEDVRAQPGMAAAVSHRMAAMAHRISGTGMDLGTPPSRCIPLRELFAPGARGWSVKQKEAALLLARENKWDFVHTKISLGKGEYQVVINGSGAHILLPGEVKAVATEVDMTQFFNMLPEAPITRKIDQKVRTIIPRM